MNPPATFPATRYRFEFMVTSRLRLPEYAGSTLRGAFGHALRSLACVTQARTCDGCPLHAACPYPAIFAPPPGKSSLGQIATPPVPYIIEPPPWGKRTLARGETLTFGFTLIGRARAHLPLCIMAWQRAFARGIGAGNGTAEFLHVRTAQGLGIYQPGATLAPHEDSIVLEHTAAPHEITLHFDTPLRLQENGHALPPARLTPRPLLTALLRRASLLAEYHGDGPLWDAPTFARLNELAVRIEGRHDFIWRDWTRRSSRQQRSMTLGGCIGSWTLQGELAPFWGALRLGQALHVGKEASFGLGRYRIIDSA